MKSKRNIEHMHVFVFLFISTAHNFLKLHQVIADPVNVHVSLHEQQVVLTYLFYHQTEKTILIWIAM